MSGDSPKPALARRVFLAASLVLVAFNLRPALSSVGPVLPEAMRDTGLTPASSWVVTTVPILLLGVFGLAAPWMARRLGSERAVLAMLFVLAAGISLRAFGTAPPLVIGCALGGVAIGAINVLLPGIVKREFPDAAAAMTGLYTMALCAGAATAAGAVAPLERALDWPLALAVWAIPALVAAAVWAVQAAPRPVRLGASHHQVGSLWRDPLAWQVTILTGLQSSLAYSTFAWLPAMLRARGLSPVEAGLVLSVAILIQAPTALIAPILATRGKDQRLWTVATVVTQVAGIGGCLFLPLSAVWGSAILLGLGQGSVFALALTIIVLRAPDAPTAAKLSSMAQGIGYSLASTGPLLMGLLRDWTGGWFWPGTVFFVVGAGAAIAGWGAGKAAYVRPR